ncbi:MAG TPA: hypothetical protein VKT77_03915 [Chthonomonadaceae bacterium]|nr:hypothetical protein [Chthonomonadaceae bacterium]
MADLRLELGGSNLTGECPCCGNRSQTVWGYVRLDGDAHAVYYARWTEGHRERGLTVTVSLGGWGGGDAGERVTVSMHCRPDPGGPQIMVIDGEEPPAEGAAVLGTMLKRAEVVGRPVAKQAFDVVDLVFVNDPRVAGFVYG